MGKGIFSKLFGRSDLKADALENLATIADVEAALAALAEERRVAQRAIDESARRRNELLLVDDSDADIAALEKATDAHRLTLERADLVEPRLLERLCALRTDARNAQWSKFQKKRDKLAVEFVGAMRGALTAYRDLLAISEEARAAGFEREAVATFNAPFHIVDEVLIDLFEADLERIREAAAGRGKAPPPCPGLPPAFSVPLTRNGVILNTPTKKAAAASAETVQFLEGAGQIPLKAPRDIIPQRTIVKKPAPDAEGRIPCVIIRPGFEIEQGKHAGKAGDVIRLPIEQAELLAARGAVEWGVA